MPIFRYAARTSFSLFATFMALGQTAPDSATVQTFKAAPSYFIANTAHHKTGKKLVEDDAVVAFVQTLRGRVMFTPSGAYVGMAIPVDDSWNVVKQEPHKRHFSLARDFARPLKTVVLKTGFGMRRAEKRGIVPCLQDQTNHVVSIFLGPQKNWQAGLVSYQKLVYNNVWDGINLEYLAFQDRLEFQLVVEPGADPSTIAMETGAACLELLDTGELVCHLDEAWLLLGKPFAYQENDASRRVIEVAYERDGNGRFGFALGDFDSTKPLVIDPSLTWSTFIGGESEDEVFGIDVDGSGNVYVTGYTESVDFPTTPGAYDTLHNGLHDVFVCKLNVTGTELSYATFLGGSNTDDSDGLVVDDVGNAYLTGWTLSTDFPTTPGAYLETHNGQSDAFLAQLNSDGTDLSYATFLGGSGHDYGHGIAIDGAGNIYVTGNTTSPGFPTTLGAFDETHNGASDAFLLKFNHSQLDLGFATFLGGAEDDMGYGLATDGSGDVFVTGETQSADFPTTPNAFDETHNGSSDVFVCKLDSTGSSLMFGTFVGGSGYDRGQAITVDASGMALVSGAVQSIDFPTTPGAFDETHNGSFDAYIFELNPTGTDLDYATFLGGPGWDYGYSIAVDSAGNAFATGVTSSPNFPTTADAYDEIYNGFFDAFACKINSTGTDLSYATYLGGSHYDVGYGVAVNEVGSVYVTGRTESVAFPTTPGAYQETHLGSTEVFVTCFDLFCYPLAHADVTGDALLCNGHSTSIQADLSGTPPWEITWSDGTHYSNVTENPHFHTVTPSVTTSYTVTDIADNNCAGTASGQAMIIVENEYGVTTAPERCVVQGLETHVFEAFVVCDIPPTEFEWTIPATGFTFGIDVNPITLDPIPSETTDYQIRVTDSSVRATAYHTVRLLVAVDPVYLDLNGDGCNNLADIWALCEDWRMEMPGLDDPNGDGMVDVLDFLYLNLDDPYPCPAH